MAPTTFQMLYGHSMLVAIAVPELVFLLLSFVLSAFSARYLHL